jgi:hypothetical protein
LKMGDISKTLHCRDQGQEPAFCLGSKGARVSSHAFCQVSVSEGPGSRASRAEGEAIARGNKSQLVEVDS